MKTCLFIIILFHSFFLFGADWTFLVYMAGDNGLYEQATEDINEMEAAIHSWNNNIIVQLDSYEYSENPSTRRYKISHDEDQNVIHSQEIDNLGELDTGNWQTLHAFLKWGMKKYHADNYAVFIWSHGNGWREKNNKYICPDNDSGNQIGIYNGDLHNAFDNLPEKIDILVLDACNMQNIEVINEITDFCDFIIGSEREICSDGFPYDDIFTAWNNSLSVKELSVLIVDKYVTSYKAFGSQNHGNSDLQVTCSVFDSDKIPNLKESISDFILSWRFNANKDYFKEIRENLQEFNTWSNDVDILQLFYKIMTNTNAPPPLIISAEKVYNSLSEAFFHSDFAGYENILNIGNATIWYPENFDWFINSYQNYDRLKFNNVKWTAFLNYTFGDDRINPLPVENLDVKIKLNTAYISWDAPPDPSFLIYEVKLEKFGENSSIEITLVDNTGFVFKNISEHNSVRVTSIDESGNRDSLSVYREFDGCNGKSEFFVAPNPVNDITQIQFKWYLTDPSNIITFRIYNISGNLVFDKEIRNHYPEGSIDYYTFPLFFSKLSTGIYFAIINNKNQTINTKFAIIK